MTRIPSVEKEEKTNKNNKHIQDVGKLAFHLRTVIFHKAVQKFKVKNFQIDLIQ